MSETQPEVRSLAPMSGQHTAEILRELGYTEEAVEKMKAKGEVKTEDQS